MTWERVVAGLEALGTGAASPRPAASFLDALAAAGRFVAAPTQSKTAFDAAALEQAGIAGDVPAVEKLVSDPAPPPPHDLLRKWVSYTKKLDDRGDFVGTGHKRLAIPKTNLSEDEIRRLGFQSVLAAVPETGQDRLRSFRRVDDNHHIHSHPNHWTLHRDEHPSLTMALQQADGPVAKLQALLSGTSHIVREGTPGMYHYLRGKVTGGSGMVDRMGSPSHIRSVKRAGVVAHVAGPSGSGKTTLMNALADKHPGLVTKDLDDFDEQAEAHLGYTGIPKKDYTDDMLSALAVIRQRTMDDWIVAQGDRPVVLGGHHWEGNHVLQLPEGADRFMLSTSPLLSAWRAYRRSQSEAPEYRRRLSELPSDWREAKSDAKRLKRLGYVTASPDEIEAAVVPRLPDQATPASKTAADRLHDLLCPTG